MVEIGFDDFLHIILAVSERYEFINKGQVIHDAVDFRNHMIGYLIKFLD
ncbi:MAG: hypothetical protein GWO28_18955 [candidate division Zixibacteria bacterium]|nr:hypothetical protein [candidate division Zixibacteria bacterium]